MKLTGSDESQHRLTIVSCSTKPQGDSNRRSAVRSICQHLSVVMSEFNTGCSLFDLREDPLQLFDGQKPEPLVNEIQDQWRRRITEATAILFGVPAYWSCPSAAFVNFINVLCGPAYDLDKPVTPFIGKTAGFFVVGADARSANNALPIIDSMLDHVGCFQPHSPVAIAEPRKSAVDWRAVNARLVVLGGTLLKASLDRG